MTAEELMTALIADIRRIENETTRKDAHRRMVVHCMNETMRWASERVQTPRPRDDEGSNG